MIHEFELVVAHLVQDYAIAKARQDDLLKEEVGKKLRAICVAIERLGLDKREVIRIAIKGDAEGRYRASLEENILDP